MSNEQLLGIMEHIIFLSAFFGGCSATFLAAILAVNSAASKTMVNWIVISSALAACCFIVCVTSSIAVVNGIHGNTFDLDNLSNTQSLIRLSSVLSMLLGVFSLLISIGLSGWLRNKLTGIVTTSISLVAISIVGILA